MFMDWREELKYNIMDVEELKKYISLTDSEELKIGKIIESYPMSITRYYVSLIDKDDPKDPIRKMCIPSYYEMDLDGRFDTSGEKQNTKEEGLQHKYPQTALILSTNVCAMYCRHCFRKRLVGQSDEEIAKAFDKIFNYIVEHNEITNVLLSGGDPLLNNNRIIEYYLKKLSQVPHIKWIRFGTRVPVVLPSRIYGDKEFLGILKKYSEIKPIYFVTQFNHPRELTEEAHKAIESLINIGVVVSNQTVLLKGVNDRPDVLAALIKKLNEFKIIPYYVFQCRPVTGVKGQFQVPLIEGSGIVEKAKAMLSGHGKRFRYVLSHETGKIEIVGRLNDRDMIFKYHQAKNPSDSGKIFIESIEEGQCWLA
jgi:KamA family protein